jgi:hypothetical protein
MANEFHLNIDNVSRQGMLGRHGVHNVYDIPPAAYFGHRYQSKGTGDVCALGLWDEAVDEPITYPFVSGTTGFCYMPNFTGPSLPGYGEACSARNSVPPCDLGCGWTQ